MKSASLNVLWDMISTEYGLAEWFADRVKVSDTRYVFTWDGYDESAVLLREKPQGYMRFQWDDDAGTAYYFEFRITRNELMSNDLSFLVSFFAEDGERDDEVLLWNKQVENLRRKLGVV